MQKQDYLLFNYYKEVIIEERHIEYIIKYKQCLDLDDMCILREAHDTILSE